MLTLNLKSGEHLTIGEDIVIRIEERSGGVFQVSVQAPRELKILRSEVIECTGKRPAGLSRQAPRSASRQAHDARQIQKMKDRQASFESEQSE